jgi:hypothetical protein
VCREKKHDFNVVECCGKVERRLLARVAGIHITARYEAGLDLEQHGQALVWKTLMLGEREWVCGYECELV